MQQPFEHQTKTTEFILTKHKCLITSDPGTGKPAALLTHTQSYHQIKNVCLW